MITYFKVLNTGDEFDINADTTEELINYYVESITTEENIVEYNDFYEIDEEIIEDEYGVLCTKIEFSMTTYYKSRKNIMKPEQVIIYWYNQKRKIFYNIEVTDDNRESSYFYKTNYIYTDTGDKDHLIAEILEKEYADYEILDEFKSLNPYLKTCPCYYIKRKDDFNNDYFYEFITIKNL